MATAKDRSVYVRRRIIVLLALIAVIAAVVLIIVRPGSAGGAKNIETVEVPTDLADQPKTEKVEAPETPACGATQLEVIPALSQPSYGAGENPELSLSVTNTGKDACIADLGTAGMSFAIASGSDEVWRSTDCQKSPESLAVILDPGETLESEAISWDRTRSSAETCDISRDSVVAGGASYHLSAMAGGVDSTETAQFLLY